jgi:hypothetical protein
VPKGALKLETHSKSKAKLTFLPKYPGSSMVYGDNHSKPPSWFSLLTSDTQLLPDWFRRASEGLGE